MGTTAKYTYRMHNNSFCVNAAGGCKSPGHRSRGYEPIGSSSTTDPVLHGTVCPIKALDSKPTIFGLVRSEQRALSHRRRAMGVEGLDGLQPPGLALLALLLGPDNRLPVRCQDEAGSGVGDLDAVAAGLVD